MIKTKIVSYFIYYIIFVFFTSLNYKGLLTVTNLVPSGVTFKLFGIGDTRESWKMKQLLFFSGNITSYEYTCSLNPTVTRQLHSKIILSES